MTTLHTRPHSALVVLDVQEGVVADAHDCGAVVATLVDKARPPTVTVVWDQRADDELAPGTEEWGHVAERALGTELESLPSGLRVGHFVVRGARAGACPCGYDVTPVGHAHTTSDHFAHGAPPAGTVAASTSASWRYQEAPGRHGGTVLTEEVCVA